MVTPTPTAWIKRPANKKPKFGAVQQIIVPTSKMTIAERYNHLVEIRELNHALTGIIIPLTNINPVVNHCTVDVVMSKSFINVGKAVVKIV